MKTITIVDDDKDLRELLQVVLRFNQCKVELFPNGEEFLQHHNTTTDLYIIDINLGGISGIEICRSLKHQPETKHIPVIIISAHPEIEKLASDVCADATLTKPFSQKTLLELIQKHLSV